MAAYFQLFAIGDETNQPVAFQRIDEEMCRHFGAECHARHYHWSWYDMIGFSLAMGRSYMEIRRRMLSCQAEHEYCDDDWCAYQHTIDIIEWMNERYRPEHWYGR